MEDSWEGTITDWFVEKYSGARHGSPHLWLTLRRQKQVHLVYITIPGPLKLQSEARLKPIRRFAPLVCLQLKWSNREEEVTSTWVPVLVWQDADRDNRILNGEIRLHENRSQYNSKASAWATEEWGLSPADLERLIRSLNKGQDFNDIHIKYKDKMLLGCRALQYHIKSY